MNPIFKKLNYKDQKEIFVLSAPPSFAKEMDEMKTVTTVKTKLGTANDVEFLLAFVIKQQDVDNLAKQISNMIQDDGVLWMVYPKGSSKKYKCEFNRDTGWTELGKLGFEPVRLVAIDEDWSALRFRRPDHIKSMTRGRTISDAGKKKVSDTRSKKRPTK